MASIYDKVQKMGIKALPNRTSPLSDADVFSQLQEHFGVSLPEDFAGFLSNFGGSYFPGKRVVARSQEPLPPDVADDDGTIAFSCFLNACGVLGNLGILRGRIPSTCLPIAETYSDDAFCLGITGKDRNKVFLWMSAYACSEPESEDTLYRSLRLVAESFADFVHRLDAH